jgi:hypothetical protein
MPTLAVLLSRLGPPVRCQYCSTLLVLQGCTYPQDVVKLRILHHVGVCAGIVREVDELAGSRMCARGHLGFVVDKGGAQRLDLKSECQQRSCGLGSAFTSDPALRKSPVSSSQ